MRHNLITIEGNIGSGKTTVSTLLARDLSAKLLLESFADNPFLPKFYAEPERYAFPLELYFMAERYQQIKKQIGSSGDLFAQPVVSDYIFTKSVLFARVTLGTEEYQLYKRLFDIINPTLPQPDLLVYLYAPIDQLLANIKKRGRDYEQSIPADYLAQLQDTYMNYFRQSPHLTVLVVDMKGIDFLTQPAAYKGLQEAIEQSYDKGMHYLTL